MSIFYDDIVTREVNPEEYIRESLKEDYKIESPEIEEEKNTYIVNCKGDVTIKPNEEVKSLTRGLYRFGSIQGNFDCSGCINLVSLERAPKECREIRYPKHLSDKNS